MRIKQIAMISILVGILGATVITAKQAGDLVKSQKQIAEQVIRFHVRANSDSKEDQSEKMKVKTQVVSYLQPLMKEAENVEDGRQVLVSHQKEIQEIAIHTLEQIRENQAVNQMEKKEEDPVEVPNVKVYLTKERFPVKAYGEFVFPSGVYEALRIDIGEAKGHNWWCVMYPSLCFLDEVHGIVPVESQQKLKHVLTEEDYNHLQPEYKLKIVELVKKYLDF